MPPPSLTHEASTAVTRRRLQPRRPRRRRCRYAAMSMQSATCSPDGRLPSMGSPKGVSVARRLETQLACGAGAPSSRASPKQHLPQDPRELHITQAPLRRPCRRHCNTRRPCPSVGPALPCQLLPAPVHAGCQWSRAGPGALNSHIVWTIWSPAHPNIRFVGKNPVIWTQIDLPCVRPAGMV